MNNSVYELMLELNGDDELEPFFKSDDRLRYYCAGGKFLDISKTGSLGKHDYHDYFSSDDEKKIFVGAKTQADIQTCYTPNDTGVYAASKTALNNRAHGKKFAGDIETDTQDHFERLYQQTIAFNNRPDNGRTCGVADFSFGISSGYLRGGKKKGATFVDLVWMDEADKRIMFIEYKQGDKALNGKSGLIDHCAKTFLCMNEKEVKELALRRYFAKKAFHGGDMDSRESRFAAAAADADNYTGYCAFMFSDLDQEGLERLALNPLRNGADRINDRIREINPDSEIVADYEKIRYVYHENYRKICLKPENFIPIK